MWNAEIISVSEVDASGAFEVIYNIFIDKKIVYPNLVTRGKTKTEITQNIQTIGVDLQTSVIQKDLLKVGDIISL